jgi:hypothetical protein
MRHFSFVIVTCLSVACFVPSFANAQRIASENLMISSGDAGIQLFMRNKHAEGSTSFPAEKVVLFVHGATYPSETIFDIDLPGGSITSWTCAAMADRRARRRWTSLRPKTRPLQRRPMRSRT